MRKMWRKIFGTAILAFVLCLVGLVMSGPVLGAGSPDSPQCVDNKNGTVTDNTAGLMWQKATDGPMNWFRAISHVRNMSLGGFSDWWLPNRASLMKLYISECKKMGTGSVKWEITIQQRIFLCIFGALSQKLNKIITV